MNEMFKDKVKLEKLFSVISKPLIEEKNNFRDTFLKLRKDHIQIEVLQYTSKLSHLSYMTGLARWLKKFFLIPDDEIIDKFDQLGFHGKANVLFRDIDQIFLLLKEIHERNVIFLDYPMVILQLIQYLELKICSFIFTDDELTIYTDRIKTGIKNELDNIKDRVIDHEQMDQLSILLSQIVERNEFGFSIKDFVNNIGPDKFDSYFFSQFFIGYITKTKESISDQDMFLELSDLFMYVTQNTKLIPSQKYDHTYGYDYWEKWQAMHIMRLLINRKANSF